VGTIIWIGVAAIIVIALVIAAIGKPGDGPGGTRNARTHRNRASVGRGSSRSYSGAVSTWGGDSGGWGGDSSGGGFSGGDCGGGGGGSC
jgi:hypothetical protein